MQIITSTASLKKIQSDAFPLLFVYSILSFFIIPSGTFSYALFLLPIIIIFVLYEVITERIKFRLSDIMIGFGILFCTFAYNYSRLKLAESLTLVCLLMLCRFPQSLDRRKLYPVYLVSMVGIVYQLMTHKHNLGVNVLSVGDPNFSAYIMLLFFMFSWKNRYLIGVILSIVCNFIFLSRAGFLGLLIFILIGLGETKIANIFLKKVKSLFPKRIPILPIVLILNFSLIVYSISYVENKSLDDVSANTERQNLSRLSNVEDQSNYARWLGNKQITEFLMENQQVFLFGVQEKDIVKLKKLKAAHNSFLHNILFFGIFYSLIYFIGLGMIIRRVYKPYNLKYLLSAIFFALFLHSLFNGVYLIFLMANLTLEPQKLKFIP